MKSRRIAIVTGRFDPGLGYQEVVFAKTLKRLGHDVRVFTTNVAKLADGVPLCEKDANASYPILRSDRHWKIGETVIPRDSGIVRKLVDFNPEAAFLLAPGHGPGYCWLNYLPKECRIISGFSDLPMHKRSRLRWWVKRRWYKKIIERTHLVITATEATSNLLKSSLQLKHWPRLEMTGLALDSAQYELEEVVCPPSVTDLLKRVNWLIAGATRIYRGKGLEEIFESVRVFLTQNPEAGFVFGGFGTDDYSQSLLHELQRWDVVGRCCFLPTLQTEEISGIFRLANCSIWSLVSVGLQQSLACGCPVVLRAGQPADHILREGITGFIFADIASLPKVLDQVKHQHWDKSAIKEQVRPYFSDFMLPRILDMAGLAP
jgi:glycosyltransferase involved in cell wall biosynthesis